MERKAPPRGVSRTSRMLAGIAGAAVILLILAGCGLVGDEYVYVEWYANYFEKYYTRWFDDFERIHADERVRVKFRAMPSGAQEKVYTMLLSNTLSDVTTVGLYTSGLLFHQDALEPVKPGDLDTDDFMDVAISLASRDDGTLAAYPTSAGLRPFIYFSRKSLVEAGTSEEEVPETFDEYIAWASRLCKWEADGGQTVGPPPAAGGARIVRRPISMIRGYVRSSFPFLLAYVDPMPDADGTSDNSLDDYLGGPPSGRPFRFDTPEVVAGLREYQKWFLPRHTAIADSDAGGVQGFQQDVYAGTEGANWIYGEVFNLDFQVTRFPHAEGRRPRLYVDSGSVGVSRNSRHKGLAVEFAKYISSTERQIDQYYGHGYLPCRYSSWDRLAEDAATDREIRERFLGEYSGGAEGFMGKAQVKRRYHDAMDVIVYVPLAADQTVLRVSSGDPAALEAAALLAEEPAAAGDGEEASAALDTRDIEARLRPAAQRLAEEIARFCSQNVNVIVQGTPAEMAEARSFVMESPLPSYVPLLRDCGVWIPRDMVWRRLHDDVITRMPEFVARENAPLSPEAAARWAQQEASDIIAGKK